MMKKVLFAILLLTVFGGFSMGQAYGVKPENTKSVKYNYVSASGDLVYTFLVNPTSSTGEIHVWPDRYIRGIGFCPRASAFICFIHPPQFIFIVPRHLKAGEKKWTYNGLTSHLVWVKKHAKLLGQTYDEIMIIKTMGPKDPRMKRSPITTCSFYSPKAGLIAARSYYKNGEVYNPLILSQERTGFGAEQKKGRDSTPIQWDHSWNQPCP